MHILNAQNVGINSRNNAPDPSAMLDVSSSNSGILIPRLLYIQRNAIDAPANGLMIYQTDYIPGFYYYDGTDLILLKKDINVMGTFISWSGGSYVTANTDIKFLSSYKYNINHTDYSANIIIYHTGIYEISYQLEAFSSGIGSIGIAINGIANVFSVVNLESFKPVLGSTIVNLNYGDNITLRNMSSNYIVINNSGVRLTIKNIA